MYIKIYTYYKNVTKSKYSNIICQYVLLLFKLFYTLSLSE